MFWGLSLCHCPSLSQINHKHLLTNSCKESDCLKHLKMNSCGLNAAKIVLRQLVLTEAHISIWLHHLTSHCNEQVAWPWFNLWGHPEAAKINCRTTCAVRVKGFTVRWTRSKDCRHWEVECWMSNHIWMTFDIFGRFQFTILTLHRN